MDKEFTSSLKSVETENALDLYFYRPIAFKIARRLKDTSVTPNMVTVLSIFVGAGTGFMFYFDNLILNLIGITLLIVANILDCVDGQLARLTGIKSKIGRILDGLAGIIWFTCIYVFFALRLGNGLFFIPAVLSGFSHFVQANITDYYKTLHLYFVSKESGYEFQNFDVVRTQYKQMKPGIRKVLFFFYAGYTSLQEAATPQLQKMLRHLKERYGDNIPEEIRLDFRHKSNHLMKTFIDLMTFNGRYIILIITVLSGHVWFYFVYEIIILNLVLTLSIRLHEKICKSFTA